MDKRSIIAILLITIILTIWTFYISIKEVPPPKQTTTQDTTQIVESKPKVDTAVQQIPDSVKILNKFGQSFAPFVGGTEKVIEIENDLVKAYISSKGATILKWYLKKFKTWDGHPSQLIWAKGGTPSLIIHTRDNVKIDDRNINYNFNVTNDYIKVSGSDSVEILAQIEFEKGRKLVKKLVFYGNKYHYHNEIILDNLDEFITPRGYNLLWSHGLRYQEINSIDESSEAKAIVSLNGEIEEIDASGNEPVQMAPAGKLDFAACKIKYFTSAIIPSPKGSLDATVYVNGYREHVADDGVIEKYDIAINVPYRGGQQTRAFDIYIGPIDYSIVKQYGISAVVNFGWRLIVRPIGEFFMLPIFKFIYSIIGNYGISIIIFALLMKILLHPLTISQMRSAQRMQLLAPEMQKIREKYKDDPQAQQKEIMKLYSEYGINPMGGCLPLLLQLPILYALWAVLRTAIDLRQAPFILWISDLSLPDYIVNFPFSILGIKHISGLAILMGITLFLQQKLTITDPRQKAMIYIFPILFVFLFSNFPSGLNLYYFMFNLFSIAHQVYINKFSKKKLTLEDLKKAPKKEGWFQRKLREAQEIAEAQGRRIPGATPTQRRQSPQRKRKK
ncbi:MAG: Inner membrane protein translocase and chaperone YidC, long form [Candidatus Kapaibacterium sp.]|nr:MAG: Inner membrane protein translocase and chaperone YidC, long form [Candidatus Kapabacteria bacterium]